MTITSTIDIQLARMRVRYAKTPLPRFFSWWWGELVGLLPVRARALFAERSEELLVGTQGRELELWRQSKGRCADFGRVALDAPAEEQRADFNRLRQQIEDPNLRIFYCIPAQRSLRRVLSLPAAAEDRLRQVLSFEMDRQTPFKADQVYFDYRVLERDDAAKNLKVDLTVVPRAQLDPQLAALAASGMNLDGVDCWINGPGTGRAGVNLLPPERRSKRSNQRLRLNLILLFVALVLMIMAMWESLANREASVAAMTEEVQKAQSDAKATQVLEKKLQDNTGSANYLFRLKHDTTTMTELVADLTRRLPDDTFLERLTVDEKGKIDIQGQSSNATKLAETLQKSDVVSKASFTGTIQTDPRTKKDRFNLSLELRKRPAPDAPPVPGKERSPTAVDKHVEVSHAPST
jgi:general secretion pathway protein L